MKLADPSEGTLVLLVLFALLRDSIFLPLQKEVPQPGQNSSPVDDEVDKQGSDSEPKDSNDHVLDHMVKNEEKPS